MAVELRDNPVAKKKATDGKSPTKAVKLDRVLAGKAETIAEDRGISVSTLLSDLVRGPIEKEWLKIMRRDAGIE